MDASSKGEGEVPKKARKNAGLILLPLGSSPRLPAQGLHAFPTILNLLVLLWAICEGSTTWYGIVTVFLMSYVYTDYWMWLLHCYLDRVENLSSKVPPLCKAATSFQKHHDFPKTVLEDNHVGSIYEMGVLGAMFCIVSAPWTSPLVKVFCVSVTLFGSLAAANHFFCHAATHKHQIPLFYTVCHRYGLLPPPRHHKIHHTAPFEKFWNFLSGFYFIYEPIYRATGESYYLLHTLFYATNPLAVQLWVLLAVNCR